MSEIVERLRAEGKDAFHQKYSLGMFKLCDDAADRIEQLEALAQGYDTAREMFTDRIEQLEAALKEAGEMWVRKDNRIEQLEAALREKPGIRDIIERADVFATRNPDAGLAQHLVQYWPVIRTALDRHDPLA